MFDKTSLHHDVDVDDDDDDVDDSERRGIQRRPNLEGLSFEHTWTPVPRFFSEKFFTNALQPSDNIFRSHPLLLPEQTAFNWTPNGILSLKKF